MTTKICSHCKQEKPTAEFFKVKKGPGGLCSRCKQCHKSTQRKENVYAARLRHRARHHEEDNARARENYYKNNKTSLSYYYKNKDKLLLQRKTYRQSERGLASSREMANRRNRMVREATPVWADHRKTKAVYLQATTLQKQTGIPHEVDHIVPLTSNLVCGLHWHENLRVLTKEQHKGKSNKLLENI